MKYAEARPLIKSGDLLGFSHKSWRTWKDIKSQIVRMVCRSEFSHVAVAWVVGERVLCIEAVIPEVRIYPLSQLGSFYWLPVKAPWKNETEELALSYVGTKYSQLDAIKAYFKPLGKGVVTECAALVLNILHADGVDLGDRATPDAVIYQALLYGHPEYFVENDR